jgi:hypothetical protein
MEKRLLEFADLSFRNFLNRYWIDEVQHFAAFSPARDQIRSLQNDRVLRDSLARHGKAFTEFSQCLPIAFM